MQRNQYEKLYTENWKNCGEKSRNVTLDITDHIDEIIKYRKLYFDCLIRLNRLVLRFIKKNNIKGGTYNIRDHILGSPKKNLPGCPRLINILTEFGFTSSTLRRSVVKLLTEPYSSYYKRGHGTQKRGQYPKYIRRIDRNKSIRIEDGIIFKNDKLILETPFGKLHLSYKAICRKQRDEYIPFLQKNNQTYETVNKKTGEKTTHTIYKKYGANIEYKKGRVLIKMRIKIPIHWKYEPVMAYATDINKKADFYLYHSDGTKTARTPEITYFVEETRKENAIIKNGDRDNLPSKQRNIHRKRVEKYQKELYKLLYPIAKADVEKAKKMKALFCIDDASTGSSNGEYGQAIIPIYLEICEDDCVPHIKTSCAYSSMLCNICDIPFDYKRDKKTNKITCRNCGEMDADFNGACNLANFGWRIWMDGYKSFEQWRKSIFPSKKTVAC